MKLENGQLEKLEAIARDAGAGILSVYESDDFDVESKGDGSPLTRADRLAHEVIVAGLAELTPEIPVVSEESAKEEMASAAFLGPVLVGGSLGRHERIHQA